VLGCFDIAEAGVRNRRERRKDGGRFLASRSVWLAGGTASVSGLRKWRGSRVSASKRSKHGSSPACTPARRSVCVYWRMRTRA
jgi:hypothetical protein